MILESLIKDESRITFDCAKATIARGSRIDIADAFFGEPEIQNAIRLGFCKVVGEVPAIATTAITPAEPTIWFKNNHSSRLSLDCIKKIVMPGEMIAIPQSKMNEVEIANAIAWNMLIDPKAPAPVQATAASPVHLEELTSKDIVTDSEPQAPAPKSAQTRREPKQVRGTSNPLIEGNNEDESMFRPSKIPDSIMDPENYTSKKKKTARQASAPKPELDIDIGSATAKPPSKTETVKTEITSEDVFDFLDIFGAEEKKESKPQKATPKKQLEEDSF